MSQIRKKFIKFDTTATGVNGQVVPANYTPTNYTPVQVGTEGTDKISAHLKGINTALASAGGGSAYDLGLTLFLGAQNVLSPANVTGFTFPNANVRSFKALVSVNVIATLSLEEDFEIMGIQRASNIWEISVCSLGQDTSVLFTVTNAGQIQYTSAATYAGFAGMRIMFRAIVTEV